MAARPRWSPPEAGRTTKSGLRLEPVYNEHQLTGSDTETKLGGPGEYRFARGVCPLDRTLAGVGKFVIDEKDGYDPLKVTAIGEG
jgi:hypothetical protein